MNAFYALKRRMLGLPDPLPSSFDGNGSGYLGRGFGDGNTDFGDGGGNGLSSIPPRVIPGHNERWTIYEYSATPHGAGYGSKFEDE